MIDIVQKHFDAGQLSGIDFILDLTLKREDVRAIFVEVTKKESDISVIEMRQIVFIALLELAASTVDIDLSIDVIPA